MKHFITITNPHFHVAMCRSPMLKPKAHLHVFYCAVMYHAIRLIKAGFLSNTFKYEDVIADPHKVII